jgi:hypothetical protein
MVTRLDEEVLEAIFITGSNIGQSNIVGGILST